MRDGRKGVATQQWLGPARGPRPLCMLTNDDGVQACGLHVLRQAAWPCAMS
jgi:hypothetical protein